MKNSKRLENYLQRLPKLPSIQQVENQLQRKLLLEFLRAQWRSVETDAFVSGWHIEAICDHLQAVSRGEIRRLIINMPPRHMKSLAVSVFWPAWEWLNHPARRWLFSSYAQSLSIRDSVKCRRVIENPKYMSLIREKHPKFAMTGDQNTKTRFDNTFQGYRLATSVDGMNTGEGGDRVVVDDPHSVMEGESQTVRESTLRWWDEVMSSRLNDANTGAFLIIMQRVHEDDLTGHVLQKAVQKQVEAHPVEAVRDSKWDLLCLPARYEGNNRSRTRLGFVDPRRVIGEPLWPERFNDEVLSNMEGDLGAYAAAGQLQQRPSPRQGGMFPRDKFHKVDDFPSNEIVGAIRYWDKAGTAGAGCMTAGVLMYKLKSNRVVVADVVYGQWDASTREARIKETALADGKSVHIWVEQEPGSGGKESAEFTIRNLAGFSVYADKVSGQGDKVRRADPFAAQVQGGNVDIVIGSWNNEYLTQHEMFPNGRFKDMVDASSGAYNKLFVRKQAGVWGDSRPKTSIQYTG